MAFLRWWLLSNALLAGCESADPVRVRVVHAGPGRAALDVEVAGTAVARTLRFGHASPFRPVTAGPSIATVVDSTTGTPLLSPALELTSGAVQTLLLTRAPLLLSHRFAAPEERLIRVRLVNGAEVPAQGELGAERFSLSPGADSGEAGLAVAANEAVSLRLSMGLSPATAVQVFTVPALPAHSELLLVLTPGEVPTLLAVTPSAALGFLRGQPEVK